jgi:hypothetical protein
MRDCQGTYQYFPFSLNFFFFLFSKHKIEVKNVCNGMVLLCCIATYGVAMLQLQSCRVFRICDKSRGRILHTGLILCIRLLPLFTSENGKNSFRQYASDSLRIHVRDAFNKVIRTNERASLIRSYCK